MQNNLNAVLAYDAMKVVPAYDTMLCPKCNKHEGVEFIVARPIDERIQKNDRRKNPANSSVPYVGDRRKSLHDRRAMNSWKKDYDVRRASNTACLACNHTWHTLRD
jgi:hypothetical protein